jgi:hypothetical protein
MARQWNTCTRKREKWNRMADWAGYVHIATALLSERVSKKCVFVISLRQVLGLHLRADVKCCSASFFAGSLPPSQWQGSC